MQFLKTLDICKMDTDSYEILGTDFKYDISHEAISFGGFVEALKKTIDKIINFFKSVYKKITGIFKSSEKKIEANIKTVKEKTAKDGTVSFTKPKEEEVTSSNDKDTEAEVKEEKQEEKVVEETQEDETTLENLLEQYPILSWCDFNNWDELINSCDDLVWVIRRLSDNLNKVAPTVGKLINMEINVKNLTAFNQHAINDIQHEMQNNSKIGDMIKRIDGITGDRANLIIVTFTYNKISYAIKDSSYTFDIKTIKEIDIPVNKEVLQKFNKDIPAKANNIERYFNNTKSSIEYINKTNDRRIKFMEEMKVTIDRISQMRNETTDNNALKVQLDRFVEVINFIIKLHTKAFGTSNTSIQQTINLNNKITKLIK